MSLTMTRVTYVWVSGKDTHHDIRGKDRIIYLTKEQLQMSPEELLEAKTFSEWNFDGSSTEQAKGIDTEIIVKPVRAFQCPLPRRACPNVSWLVVLCECFLPNGQPTPDNTRYIARTVFDADVSGHRPWFGMEQEYVLKCDGRPYGWPANGFPAPQGPYYCGFGPQAAYGRKFVDTHLELCMAMGLKVSGVNAEVTPSQWEFQIGPCEGIEIGDHMIMARWLYLCVLEKFENEGALDIDYSARPIPGDWNGSGMHTNYSTEETRAENGLAVIEQYCERLNKTVYHDIAVYGKDNNIRLTGKHETSRYDQFSSGVGTRTTSIRIPNQVKQERRGYMEDRRPAGDADPYLVSARLFASTTGTKADLLEKYADNIRQPWMRFAESSVAQ